MSAVRDDGEPLSPGQLDRRAADARARRDAFLGVALFTGVVLVNGILAILLIALMQALGLWTPAAAETPSVAVDGVSEMRSNVQLLVQRQTAPSAGL